MLQNAVLLHIRAIGDHNAHGKRHRVEQLAHRGQHGIDGEVLHARQQVVLEPGAGARDGQRIAGDDDGQDDEHGHHNAADLFDALLDAAQHDHSVEQHIDDKPSHRRVEHAGQAHGRKVAEVGVGGRLDAVPGQEVQQVFDDPAADDAVIGRDDHRHKGSQPAQKPEPFVKRAVRADAG